MRPDHGQAWPRHAIEVTWTGFAALNLVAMFLYPDWETIPFHVIWVSFALLYGLRAWGLRSTVFALAVVGAATGILITVDGLRSHTFPARAIEAPLMTAMLAAMVWHVRRYLTALRHIREISEKNQALLARERRFVQNASHELRTPITVALGHAELLARVHRDDPDAEDFTVIVDELSHLRRLARQLLTLAALDEPGSLSIGPVEVESFLRQTLRRWAPVDRRWSIGQADVTMVNGDAARLRAAVDALVDNAVKHTSPGDRIELSATMKKSHCAITVTDTGPGIPPGVLGEVFERFARADTDRAECEEGFGLGLPLVKAVAEAHGGTARVTAGQAGTEVTILLPAAETREPSSAQASPAFALPGLRGRPGL